MTAIIELSQAKAALISCSRRLQTVRNGEPEIERSGYDNALMALDTALSIVASSLHNYGQILAATQTSAAFHRTRAEQCRRIARGMDLRDAQHFFMTAIQCDAHFDGLESPSAQFPDPI